MLFIFASYGKAKHYLSFIELINFRYKLINDGIQNVPNWGVIQLRLFFSIFLSLLFFSILKITVIYKILGSIAKMSSKIKEVIFQLKKNKGMHKKNLRNVNYISIEEKVRNYFFQI